MVTLSATQRHQFVKAPVNSIQAYKTLCNPQDVYRKNVIFTLYIVCGDSSDRLSYSAPAILLHCVLLLLKML
jgi:hypothetical protein